MKYLRDLKLAIDLGWTMFKTMRQKQKTFSNKVAVLEAIDDVHMRFARMREAFDRRSRGLI